MADEQKQMTLDAVLDETPPATPETPPAPERADHAKQVWRDKEQEAKGRVRDPNTGQYAPKEPKADIPEPPKAAEPAKEPAKAPEPVKAPVEEYSPREKAAFAKAADETRKRQALERQIAELKKEPAKTFYEDPDGALEKMRLEQDQKLQYATLSTRVQTSESIARSRYPDYDQMFTVFNELVKQSPFLAEQAFTSSDPAEFAYHTARTQKQLQEAGGIEKMKAKMEEELRTKVRAELEAELKAKQETLEKERAALPGSLTDVQSKGTNRPVWGGPTPLDAILKD